MDHAQEETPAVCAGLLWCLHCPFHHPDRRHFDQGMGLRSLEGLYAKVEGAQVVGWLCDVH